MTQEQIHENAERMFGIIKECANKCEATAYDAVCMLCMTIEEVANFVELSSDGSILAQNFVAGFADMLHDFASGWEKARMKQAKKDKNKSDKYK